MFGKKEMRILMVPHLPSFPRLFLTPPYATRFIVHNLCYLPSEPQQPMQKPLHLPPPPGTPSNPGPILT